MRAPLLFSLFLVTPALARAQAPCTPDAGNVVEAAYRQVLERGAGRDSGAMINGLTNGGLTVRELIRAIAKSPEYRQRFLGVSNGPNGRDAAVANLYRHLLGRDPDPGGLRAHAAAFANGDVDAVIDSMINSPEYQMGFGQDTVPGSKVRYCGRQDTRANPGDNRGNRDADGRDNARGNFPGDNRDNFPGRDDRDNRDNRDNFPGRDDRDNRDNFPGDARGNGPRDDRGNPGGFPRETAGNYGAARRFEDMDRNRNGAIERNEWVGTRAAFDARDWNRDGILSGDELRNGARRNPRAVGDEDFAPGRAPAWTADNFRRMDRNRDNRLTATEWYFDAEFFRRADRNRDGMLVLDEFVNTGFDDDRDVRFEDLDFNRNGRVERNEWQGSLDAFRWLDRNNDNVLSRAEVVGDADTRFDSFAGLDVNRSGTIGLDEWRWSRRSFDQYDVNRDGQLTRREFAAVGATPGVYR